MRPCNAVGLHFRAKSHDTHVDDCIPCAVVVADFFFDNILTSFAGLVDLNHGDFNH